MTKNALKLLKKLTSLSPLSPNSLTAIHWDLVWTYIKSCVWEQVGEGLWGYLQTWCRFSDTFTANYSRQILFFPHYTLWQQENVFNHKTHYRGSLHQFSMCDTWMNVCRGYTHKHTNGNILTNEKRTILCPLNAWFYCCNLQKQLGNIQINRY